MQIDKIDKEKTSDINHWEISDWLAVSNSKMEELFYWKKSLKTKEWMAFLHCHAETLDVWYTPERCALSIWFPNDHLATVVNWLLIKVADQHCLGHIMLSGSNPKYGLCLIKRMETLFDRQWHASYAVSAPFWVPQMVWDRFATPDSRGLVVSLDNE